MDWIAVREELRRVRAEKGVSLRKLRKASQIDPSTIHRIENVKKYPNHAPDLDTIDALVRGMGITLSQFFATGPTPLTMPVRRSRTG